MDELIWFASIGAALALVISVVNAIRISGLRKQLEVDLVNHREDVNLSMESIKFTATREVKNLRKEINKRNKPPQPRKAPLAKAEANVDVVNSADKEGDNSKPRRNPNPNPNRQRNYRPKKKPILKKPEDSPTAKE